eukprot:5928075-Amphidinium_carterae.2
MSMQRCRSKSSRKPDAGTYITVQTLWVLSRHAPLTPHERHDTTRFNRNSGYYFDNFDVT